MSEETSDKDISQKKRKTLIFTAMSSRIVFRMLGGRSMAEFTKVALDAMGGDNAPVEIVKGAVDAVNKRKDIRVALVGKEEIIKKELQQYTYDKEQIEIVNADEVIETAEPPVNAIRKKKNSSIVVAMGMVKRGEADAFVSAGSSGAVLVGGQVLIGRIKGVERPPLAPLLPTKKGFSLLIDPAIPPGAVRKDGIDLHGTCNGNQKSESCDRKYRSGRGKGKCTGKRNVSAFERVQGYQFYRKHRGKKYTIWRCGCHCM